jgi:hypothetical protein
MKRHPAAIASDKYFATKEGSSATDPQTLGEYNHGAVQYLTNRLHAAFQAGYSACANQTAQEAKEAEEAEKQEFFRLHEKFGHLL